MNIHSKTPQTRIAIIAVLLLTFGLACLCLPSGFMPTEEPDQAPTTFPTQTLPVPPEIQDPGLGRIDLSPGGPWLLVETPDGLWAANSDGSGLTRLTEDDYWGGRDIQNAIQPGGHLVAFISPRRSEEGKTLNLISLPGGYITRTIELTTPETEDFVESTGSEAIRAFDNGGYAWSPDGTRLAFVGLLDGPTADIYLYQVASGDIQRVSQDDSENYAPSWSPDGSYLLFYGADGFGTGAGFDTTGVWIARGDGTDVRALYTPGEEIEVEELVGWLDDTTAVISSWNFKCGMGHTGLRLFNILTSKTVVLNEGCFDHAGANSRRGEVLFASEDGLYLATTSDRDPVRISQDEVARIDPWRPDNDLLSVHFENGSLATFGGAGKFDHQVSPVKTSPGTLDVATYGAIWGWTSYDENQPGVWISGPGVEIGQIFSERALAPIWNPENDLFFFARETGESYSLYRITFDSSYQDLSEVDSLEASFIQGVTWLGFR